MCLYLNLLLQQLLCWPFSRTSSSSSSSSPSSTAKPPHPDERKSISGQPPDRSQQTSIWLNTNKNKRQREKQLLSPAQSYYASNLIGQTNLKPLDGIIGKKKDNNDNENKGGKKKKKKMSDTLAAADDERHLQMGRQQSSSSENNNNNNNNTANDSKTWPSDTYTTNGLVTTTSNAALEDQAKALEAAAAAAAAKFKIRTKNRRHLDFDDEYDLNDVHASNRSRWPGAFYFIQAADSQLGMIDSYVHKRTEPGWREEIELCEKLVSVCNQMEPRPLFIIICGDLVDSFPGSEIGQKQVVDFKRIFAKLDDRIPLVCVCGNHDIGNEPTIETVTEFRRTFGDDYYYFTKYETLFIVINSQFYQHREFVQDIAREQDEWLEEMLAKCKLFKYSIVFEHIPWFLESAHEENDYFNIRKEVRLQWLRKFKEAGVTKIMCGHYHRNAGGWFEGLELVVTSAIGAQCGNDKSGARIVRVLEDSIEHNYYAMPDIPLKIEL